MPSLFSDLSSGGASISALDDLKAIGNYKTLPEISVTGNKRKKKSGKFLETLSGISSFLNNTTLPKVTVEHSIDKKEEKGIIYIVGVFILVFLFGRPLLKKLFK